MSHSYTELELAVLARNGANAMAGVQKCRADRWRKRAEEAEAEVERLEESRGFWRAFAAKREAERDAARSEAASADVLHIVSDWCIEANEVGGVDAGDLAWRLEQAGYPFADPH